MSGPEDREGAPDRYASSIPFRPAEPDPLVQRALPVAKELPGYRTPTGRRDLLAGVTVAALAIPSAMADAELAGALALLVAACFLIARLLRLGWLADYPLAAGARRVHPRRRGRADRRPARQAHRDRHRRRRPCAAARRAGPERRRTERRVVVLAPAAAGLFLVSFADEVLTARSFAGRHSQHIHADQELLAMGAANAAAGIS